MPLSDLVCQPKLSDLENSEPRFPPCTVRILPTLESRAKDTRKTLGDSLENLNQIRLRSEKELDQRLQGLLSVTKVLDAHLSKWFISDGAALGAVRGGDFIPWDWDVEITVMTEEARPMAKLICRDLKSEGLAIVKKDSTRSNFKIKVNGFGTTYEILGRYLKKGEIRARLMKELPAKFFVDSEMAPLRGHWFPVPSPVRDYLTVNYGDWETPRRTADHEDYLEPSVYVNRTTVRKEFVARARRAAKLVRKILLRLRKMIAD